MPYNKVVFVVFFSALFLSNCSVYMAAVGTEEKNVDTFLSKGVDRQEVEFHLGSPRTVVHNADGTTTHIFEYEIGNEPSLGRAIGHGAMNIVTFGFWEVIGTPIEAFAGETVRISVTY